MDAKDFRPCVLCGRRHDNLTAPCPDYCADRIAAMQPNDSSIGQMSPEEPEK